MQFKRKGNKINVLAYRGYDREKRRAVVKMVGSMSAHTYTPSENLLENLTDDEREELQKYIEDARQESDRQARRYAVDAIPSRLADAAEAITAGEVEPSEAWAAEVWAAMTTLGRALRRAGLPRPRRPRRAGTTAEGLPGQASLITD